MSDHAEAGCTVGSQVLVRDEEWVVRSIQRTSADGWMVKVLGTSEFVRDQEATYFSNLDRIIPLRPEDTKLVPDPTPGYRRSRLWLEAQLRKTPVALGETRLAVSHRQLLDPLAYQRRPAQMALESLQPRLLIADTVGLGKTLEVGMILSELIRRGRGDRILVVTPQHILEQFQHELWTRFALPLVRLDSVGIQRVRQRIPASRNPFTFYKRIIISIDTLKNVGRYRHHLEGIRWDAVVIDECHSLINAGTLNNQLAKVLAPRTDALILTSATPHNGKPESFAELVKMLDPVAIADPSNYTAESISHLYVRRHKHSSEVDDEVGAQWAKRLPPKGVEVAATAAEEAVFTELSEVWLHPQAGQAPMTGQGRQLFPYHLLKSFLSSHRALADTVEARRKTIAAQAPTPERDREDQALQALEDLANQVDDETASKLTALERELKQAGVGKGSPTRVVVFSERHATLHWLERTLPQRLGLKPEQVAVLHGGLGDQRQMEVVAEFGLEQSPIRLLLTGDIASEGVNLHRACHHLVHFDLPWSLITIEQRNGRIDRYGQLHSPDIRALLLTSTHDEMQADLLVLDKLLSKEDHAHRALGDAGSLMGLRSADDETQAVMEALRQHRPLDEIMPDVPSDGFDLMMLLTGEATAQHPVVASFDPPTLFVDDAAFVDEALRETFADLEADLDLRRDDALGLLTFRPPADLQRRLEVLPQRYLDERKVLERIKLTSLASVANESLRRAREDTDLVWPEVSYLSGQHPVVEWLADKVLVGFGRNQAPVMVANVASPMFLMQGVYANSRGQAVMVEWFAVAGLGTEPYVRPFAAALAEAGVHAGMANPTANINLPELQALVPAAVEKARQHLVSLRKDRSDDLGDRIRTRLRQIRAWRDAAVKHTQETGLPQVQAKKAKDINTVAEEASRLVQSLAAEGAPMVRLVAVLAKAQP